MPPKKRTTTSSGPATTGDDGVGRPGTPAQGRALRARGQRTMRRLIDAGITVFARHGYHAARVDDIVKAAKTSHGTFYLYFSSKEDLLAAVVADVAEELAAVSAELGPVTPDRAGAEALRAWLARFVEVYQRYGPVIRSWTEAEVGSTVPGQMGADLLGALAAGLSGKLAADVAPADPAVASLALVAMVERLNYFVQSGQVDASLDDVLDTLTHAVHAGLFGPAASRT